jgi:hypothetical protein
MRSDFLRAAAAVALAAGAAPASAVTIDSFDTFQAVADVVSGAPGDANQVAAPEAIGGWRDMYVQKVSGPVGRGTSATSGDGILSFSNDSLTRGFGCVTWDGSEASADCNDVDVDGLGGIDLLSMGPGFDFEVIQVDHLLEFTMKVWDTAGVLSTYFEVIPPIEELETFLAFSQFDGSANFSSVGAIQIFVNAPVDDLDGSIGEVSVVPLPASALLLLGGLGGLSAFRARRRKS